MQNIILLVLFTVLVSTTSYGQSTYAYQQPQKLEDGWLTSDLQSQKIDTARIYQLFNQLQGGEHKIHSVLLVKNRQLIIEEYFNGHSVDQPHDLRSTTKSIRSILMGIAIDKGFIESVNDPIFNYLKTPVPTKNLDERKKDITIKHLLTMSTGLECNDWDKKSKGQEDRVYKKKDWLQYTLNLPMANEPGTVSHYCSMGVVLAAEIISQASGMTIDAFAEKYLFEPLNIHNLQWGHTSNKEVMPSAKRLYLTSRDMAKIGQLILSRGKWNSERVVSAQWVEKATTPQTKITNIDYGYLWWNIPFKVGDNIIVSKVAMGNGGQYIMVVPALDMVAVFTGGAYNSEEDKLPFAIMKDIFLPTFVSKK
ncbi:MAG: serine hydrolase [Bacteroidota bacterium]